MSDACERETEIAGGWQDERSLVWLIDIDGRQGRVILHVELDGHFIGFPCPARPVKASSSAIASKVSSSNESFEAIGTVKGVLSAGGAIRPS